MSYGLPISVQVSNFLFALGLGFIAAVAYYVIMLLRKIFSSSPKALFAQDIIFGVVSAVLCFVFLNVYCDGQVRVDLILSAGLGFAIFVYSVGGYANAAVNAVSAAVKKVVHLLLLPVSIPIKAAKKVAKKIKSAVSSLKNSREKSKEGKNLKNKKRKSKNSLEKK